MRVKKSALQGIHLQLGGGEVAKEAGGVGVAEGERGRDAALQLLLPLRGQGRQHPVRLLLAQPHVRRRQAVLQPGQHLHTAKPWALLRPCLLVAVLLAEASILCLVHCNWCDSGRDRKS